MNSIPTTDLPNTSVTLQQNIDRPLPNLVPARFTEKPLKVCASLSGLQLEQKHSLDFHAEGIPVLVSPQLLRSRDLGQLDLIRLNKDKQGWMLEVAEVKSSQTGAEASLRGQRSRIFSAQNFLSSLLGVRTRFCYLK